MITIGTSVAIFKTILIA